MSIKEAIDFVNEEFAEFKKSNKDDFFKITGYKHRNMELNFIKGRYAEALVELDAIKDHNDKLTKLYVASEYELKQLKND